ncbi:MAG: hypothetical protein R2779_05955 [Crocinitomicaceae bacterium]
MAHGVVQKSNEYKSLYQGQIPGNNLLNPFAWSKFVKDWKEGKLKRQ